MPLSQDQIRALQTHVTIPPGSVPGTRLTWLGPTDSDVDWTSEPDQQIRDFTGDPNGVVFAPKGTLGVERDVPALWQNTDGVSAWSLVGSGGGFPITEDDGTNTGTIDFTSHNLLLTNTLDAGSVLQNALSFFAGGFTELDDFGGGGIYLQSTNATAGGDVTLESTKGSQIAQIDANSGTTACSSTLLASPDGSHIAEVTSYGVNGTFGTTPTIGFHAEQNIFSNQLTAIASASLGPSNFSIWLDDTNGAGKLMIKAKTANGTVVTGSVTLT